MKLWHTQNWSATKQNFAYWDISTGKEKEGMQYTKKRQEVCCSVDRAALRVFVVRFKMILWKQHFLVADAGDPCFGQQSV